MFFYLLPYWLCMKIRHLNSSWFSNLLKKWKYSFSNISIHWTTGGFWRGASQHLRWVWLLLYPHQQWSLWFPGCSLVHPWTPCWNKYFRKNSLFGIILHKFEPWYTIPAGWPVQSQLIPNPALHLPSVHLLVVHLAGASLNPATSIAYLDPCRRPETSTVFGVKVNTQLVLPRRHIRKDIFHLKPA